MRVRKNASNFNNNIVNTKLPSTSKEPHNNQEELIKTDTQNKSKNNKSKSRSKSKSKSRSNSKEKISPNIKNTNILNSPDNSKISSINNTEEEKFIVYDQSSDISINLNNNNINKKLLDEIASLKKIISNKEKFILDLQFENKKLGDNSSKLKKINISLNNEINYLKKNFKSEQEKMEMDLQKKLEAVNKEFIILQKELNEKNRNEKNNNNALTNSINNIKKNLNGIEIAHSAQLNDKDKIIEELNEELVKIYNEYMNLSNILQQMNEYVKVNNYNDLKEKFDALMKEKDFLVEEKKNNDIIKKKVNEKNNEIVMKLKNKEKKYIKQINDLYKAINERDDEIEKIKKKYEDPNKQKNNNK